MIVTKRDSVGIHHKWGHFTGCVWFLLVFTQFCSFHHHFFHHFFIIFTYLSFSPKKKATPRTRLSRGRLRTSINPTPRATPSIPVEWRKKISILVRNFYVWNTGNLRNFYVEIEFGHCQWNSVLGPIGQTDSAIVHGTGGVRTHILTVLLNIVRTGHRNGHRNVSQSENKQQSAWSFARSLLGDSDLHRPINNSDGRPLGLPSDSGHAHKYQKLDVHTQGDMGVIREQCLKPGWKRPRTDQGAIMAKSHFVWKKIKDVISSWTEWINGWEWTKNRLPTGKPWPVKHCQVLSIHPSSLSICPSVCLFSLQGGCVTEIISD